MNIQTGNVITTCIFTMIFHAKKASSISVFTFKFANQAEIDKHEQHIIVCASTSLFIHDDEGDLHEPVYEGEVQKMKHINCNMRSIRLAIVLAIVYQGLIFCKRSSLAHPFLIQRSMLFITLQ